MRLISARSEVRVLLSPPTTQAQMGFESSSLRWLLHLENCIRKERLKIKTKREVCLRARVLKDERKAEEKILQSSTQKLVQRSRVLEVRTSSECQDIDVKKREPLTKKRKLLFRSSY